jgi:hypothetical protein
VLGADTLPQLLNDSKGQKCADNMSELERDIELAFQEREDLSIATPNPPLLHRHSPELMCEQIDQERDLYRTSLGVLEEPKHGSLHYTQAEEDKLYRQQLKQEAVSTIATIKDRRSMPDQAELAESCSYEDGREVASSNTSSSECSSSSHSINDEDDEDLQPAKRQKRDIYSLPAATLLKLFDTEKSELASLARDPDQEWEICNIVGWKIVNREKHYLVD